MDSALGLLGLALRAGRLAVGEDAAADACAGKKCRLLLTAANAGPHTLKRAAAWAREGQCLMAALPCGREALGAALGRGQCSVAALTDLGLAAALAGKLAGEDPAAYGPLVRRLELKKKRSAERRALRR